MSKYKEIHIWNFPPTETYIKLKKEVRHDLLTQFVNGFKSGRLAIDYLNSKSERYGIKRKYSSGSFYHWKKGYSIKNNKKLARTIPLWVLIEISKSITFTKKSKDNLMKTLERNVEYYNTISGSSRIYSPKLPLQLTPELVSIIFHFCGDGHIGDKKTNSSYRQMNNEGLKNFLLKLNNIFGDFKYNKNEFKSGKLYIPKIITKFYTYYFNLPNTNTFNAYIPNNIKSLQKNFLLAGLTAFITDEGNIGEVIEIYSSNPKLLRSVRNCAKNCGYLCRKIRTKKERGGISYRFLISSSSYLFLNEDILKLEKEFPLCNFAHKMKNFERLIKQKNKEFPKYKDGITKIKILNLLRKKERTVYELTESLNYGNSSIREHLWDLEKIGKVKRSTKENRKFVWSTK